MTSHHNEINALIELAQLSIEDGDLLIAADLLSDARRLLLKRERTEQALRQNAKSCSESAQQ